MTNTVLIVDDNEDDVLLLQRMFRRHGLVNPVRTFSRGDEAIGYLAGEGRYSERKYFPYPAIIFLDLLMPDQDGLETLEQIRQIRPTAKAVMLSCVADTPKVVQAMRLGAQDYLTKPFEKNALETVIHRYLAPKNAGGEVHYEMEDLGDGQFFIAGTPAMKKIRAEVGLISNVDIPVLLLGESGTGKEVVARLIHKRSNRANRPFMKVNCAALPADLLESELFGYEAGAFTGANRAKPGKFEVCNKGTLLLDEIGEMPTLLQAKLLRVLEERVVHRLGSRKEIPIDVRILALLPARGIHGEYPTVARAHGRNPDPAQAHDEPHG